MELNEYYYVCRIFCLIQEQIEWRNLFYIPIFQAITISTCKYWMSLICFDCLMCRCTILSIVWKKYVHYFMQFSLVSFRVKWTYFCYFSHNGSEGFGLILHFPWNWIQNSKWCAPHHYAPEIIFLWSLVYFLFCNFNKIFCQIKAFY